MDLLRGRKLHQAIVEGVVVPQVIGGGDVDEGLHRVEVACRRIIVNWQGFTSPFCVHRKSGGEHTQQIPHER